MLYPAAGNTFSLLDAWQLARKNDQSYLADLKDLEAQRKGSWQTLTDLGPQLDGSYGYTRNHDWMRYDIEESAEDGETSDSSDTTQDAWYNEQIIELSLEQPLFDLKKINAARKSSVERRKYDLLRHKADEDLLLKVAELYFAILDAQSAVQLSSAERATLEKQVEYVTERRSVGMGTSINLYDTKSRFNIARAKELEAKATLDNAWRELEEILGPDAPFHRTVEPLGEIVPFHEEVQDIAVWQDMAMKDNIDLNIRRIESRIYDFERKMVRSDWCPTISLVGDYSYTSDSGGLSGYGTDDEEYSFGVVAKIPLFRGGGRVFQSSQAARQAVAAHKRVRMQTLQLDRELNSTFTVMQTVYATIEAYRDAVETGEKALELKKIGFEEGESTGLDVLDAQRDYYSDAQEYHKARYRYALAVLNFKKMVGVLSEKDLALDGEPMEDNGNICGLEKEEVKPN